MPIDRISRLRDYCVFRDFTWPAGLSDFVRYNLIYGWNGSGKTTMSRLFRDLELRRPPAMGAATIRINGGDVSGSEFPHVTLQVRVFNRDFVNESVFSVSGGDVPPIFVVGKDSIEKQKEVDGLKGERTTAEASLTNARAKKQRAEQTFDKFCQDRARGIKDVLRSPGPNPYNNYDKSDFQSRAQKMTTDGDGASHRLAESELDTLRAQIAAKPKPRVPESAYRLPETKGLADATAPLLSTTVVSAAIKTLKDDPALADWTRKGLGLHRDTHAEKCLFCEQPLPPDRLADLEAHFSAEYEQYLRRLDEQIEALRSESTRAGAVILPKQIEVYDDLGQEYADAEQKLQKAIEAVRAFLDDLVRILVDKRSRPFDRLSLDITVPDVATDAVDRLNGVLRKHNQTCDEFESRIASSRDRLALGLIAGALEEFVRLQDAVQSAHAAIAPAEQDVRRLINEIERLEREIVEHRRPAEELNDDLRKYLGHGELQLAIMDTGYSIMRNGVPADMLSEGEMTAIALLYFLKALEDRGFDKLNGVVVLDDPVSSLDANAMHLAFSLMRERTADAGQLFVLTHNFAYFRQVRNWLHHGVNKKRKNPAKHKARFYMLQCAEESGKRTSVLCPLDPLLLTYESEYHFLFASVYRFANGPMPDGLEACYGLPNVARRLVESFLAFRHPGAFDNLWGALREVSTSDEARKGRILNFVQTHSHGPGTGQPEHDPSILGESRSILREVLALIESEDSEHYAAMKNLVDPGADAENPA